ncbi:thiamine ABC transporter permease [Streptomyces sp. WZ.A104]|uniref:ATP-binding cassette domain-containing protein n=1 Tax=Streptomyces sp. WZ.A104 TaxID=2023771 RepID=UPI000BBC24B1|nr:excinuclease ABC subunit UvrA [Streptomyces sp. WZ.A104]PCG81604.1 thiamine ABC transporter permease [Streptomyces sp. WZ.A104]
MSTDAIKVTGARENNLKNVSVEIPKRSLTVFTGVSGSGKSSLVFDTIAAEAQRQLNETFTAFVRKFLPDHGRPDMDAIENISAAVVIDQKRLGGNPRSTVGTITDINPLLRLLFSRAGDPAGLPPGAFSFNDPQGMCPACEGLGRVVELDLDAFIDRTRSLNQGALLHPDFSTDSWYWLSYVESGLFDNDKPLADFTEQEWSSLLHGEMPQKLRLDWQGNTLNVKYEGLAAKFTRLYIKKEDMSERSRQVFQRFVRSAPCADCEGTRLAPAARACRIAGHRIADLTSMEAERLGEVLAGLDLPAVKPVLDDLVSRLGHLAEIGLGYLSLDRETRTLSGGESQRIKMVRHLSSSLNEMLYVFDEPSVGLHARDVHRLKELLLELRDKGNTVLVVEHDPDVMAIADHVVDMGPKAGTLGGEVVFEGSFTGLAEADTLTGRHLRHRLPVKAEPRRPTGALTVTGANSHNLRDVTVDFPTGVLTVVTGVAGSGKSSLVNDDFLNRHPDAIVIDQSAVAGSRRSSTATYTGLLDPIRKLFAKANNVSASLFSANSKGACPNCQGLGVLYTDLAFLETLKSVCEVCQGRRFSDDVLGHRLRGRSISDVLAMTASEAADFFTEPKLRQVLRALTEVGLDYVGLGQPLSTLSGGECQRLKLATDLHRVGSVYVMDEPTTGLHMSDTHRLLGIVERLVDQGNTVIVIEHNLDIVKSADWVIDLGPEGGSGGGRILFEGTPAELLKATGSHTAEYLRRDLSGI